MHAFHNILVIANGSPADKAALVDAFTIARKSSGKLTVVVEYPELPERLTNYTTAFEKAVIDPLQQHIENLMQKYQVQLDYTLVAEHGRGRAIRYIRRMLKNKHDILVKAAASRKDGTGLLALDMELLRKCPLPVMLCRPNQRSRERLHNRTGTLKTIAVAVDATYDDREQIALSHQLLNLTQRIAKQMVAEVHVISCWDYEHEHWLRNNGLARMPQVDINQAVLDAETHNLQSLETLMAHSKLSHCHMHHLRGSPEHIIPKTVKHIKTDLLVMGTIARTGIAGFFIGNTAENILQNVNTSLLTIKPLNFKSPVNIEPATKKR